MKIGITGGIGSGKSYVSKRLALHGIEVYDCDAAAKRLIRTSPTLQQQIVSLTGSLEKAAMSRFLLASEENKLAMNAIIHPAVFEDFRQSGMLWMESAIMYESRIARVMQRDGISREKAQQWMDRQWTQEQVRQRADYEIVNDGKADIDQQIEQLLAVLDKIDGITK